MTVGQRTARGTHRAGSRDLWVLLAYCLLTAIMTWPLARQPLSAIPGDSFDGWQNYWNLWWMKLALVDRVQSPLFTDLLYAPTGVGLYFHTLNPFNGLITLPVQLTAGLIGAYNVVVLISWVLGGYGAYLLTLWVIHHNSSGRHERGGMHAPNSSTAVFGAFLAGAIFTFSAFHMAHLLGHMQVLSLEWIPFYVLYLLRALAAVQTGRAWFRSALLAGLFLVLVGLCDWYFVLYLFFFTGLAVLWTWGQLLRQNRAAATVAAETDALGRRIITGLRLMGAAVWPAAVAGAFFLVVLSPLLVPMVREALAFDFMVRPPTDLYILSASVADFLIPNRLHAWFRPASFGWIGNQIAPVSERTIGLGYGALALAAVALWRARARSWFWVVTGLFFLAMALGPRIHLGNLTMADIPVAPEPSRTLFGLLNEWVPFMRISRSVSRYALMVTLSVAVLSGMGFAALGDWLADRTRRRRVAPLFAIALLLVLAENWVVPFPMSLPDTPAYYTTLAADGRTGALLNLPMNYDRPGYLLYQTVHGKPLTVAYISRDDPRTLTERMPVLQHFRHLGPDILVVDPATLGMSVLADLGVDTVVLDRYKMPGGLERTYTEELAQAIFAGQPPLHEDERITVYGVEPPADTFAYPILGPLNWGPLSRTPEDGAVAARRISAQPAEVAVVRMPADAHLRLRYRTTPGTTFLIAGDASTGATVTGPPAVDWTDVVLSPEEMGLDPDGGQTVTFTVQTDGGDAWVAEIALQRSAAN